MPTAFKHVQEAWTRLEAMKKNLLELSHIKGAPTQQSYIEKGRLLLNVPSLPPYLTKKSHTNAHVHMNSIQRMCALTSAAFCLSVTSISKQITAALHIVK